MSEELENIGKQADAVAEVAKTTNNAINKGADLTKFIGKILGPSLNNLGEICEQHTTFWKIQNGLKLRDKLYKILEERGDPKLTELPLRIGLPLLDAALNEDDTNLQDLWANLLASSMTNKGINKSTKTYIEILKQLDIEDAELLNMLFLMNSNALINDETEFANVKAKTPVEISFAVNNLERLSLIQVHTHDEKQDDSEAPIIHFLYTDKDDPSSKSFSIYISLKILGDHFMQACVGGNLIFDDGGHFIFVDDRFKYNEYNDTPVS